MLACSVSSIVIKACVTWEMLGKRTEAKKDSKSDTSVPEIFKAPSGVNVP
jgi:hypothetical protein